MVEFAKVISEKVVVMYITRMQANNRASTVPVSQAGKPTRGGPRVLALPFEKGVKPAEKANPIDLYLSGKCRGMERRNSGSPCSRVRCQRWRTRKRGSGRAS